MKIVEIEKNYQERIQTFSAEESRIRKRLTILSILRFFSFVSAIVLVVFLIEGMHLFKIIGSIFFFALFILFVIYYFKQTSLLNHYKNLIKINYEEKEALNNNFSFFNES